MIQKEKGIALIKCVFAVEGLTLLSYQPNVPHRLHRGYQALQC